MAWGATFELLTVICMFRKVHMDVLFLGFVAAFQVSEPCHCNFQEIMFVLMS
jgi:hypothetical protein